MSRQVIVLSAVLAASLVGSYLKWTSEEGTDSDDTIVILDATAEQLTQIDWTSEKVDLSLFAKSDSAGDYVLVKAVEHKKVPLPPEIPLEPVVEEPQVTPAPGEEGEEAVEKSVPEPEERFEMVDEAKEFKGGEAADKLLASMAPMVANRALADLTPEKATELGFDEPGGTLTVTREGKDARVFTVGGEAYGTRDLYLRDDDSGKVYLIDDELLRPLKYGTTRLPDRELLGISADELTSITVNRPATADYTESTTTLEQSNRADPKAAYWGFKGAGEKDEEADGWVNKLLRVRSASYVQPEATPLSTQTMANIKATGEEGVTVELELLKGQDPEGEESWYARSSHTRLMVQLHDSQASGVFEDLETFIEDE